MGEAVPTPKGRGFGGGTKCNPRSRDEAAGYLGPKMTRLEEALEARGQALSRHEIRQRLRTVVPIAPRWLVDTQW